MIKYFFLIFIVACSHKQITKIDPVDISLVKSKEVLKLIEEENKAPAYTFPFYSSSRFIHDSFVESIYKELSIDTLENKPQYLFSNFNFNPSVLAQHHNNIIYINVLVWDSLRPEIKRDLILHELGHWVGMVHEEQNCDTNYKVMCRILKDENNRIIEQDKTQFYKDFDYLVHIKDRELGF